MILGGLFPESAFSDFGRSLVSRRALGGSLPCVRGSLSGEKKTDIYPRLLSHIHTSIKTYSRLTTHTLDSLTDILIYNMAKTTHTDASGKSTKTSLTSVISQIREKISRFDNFSKSTQKPDSIAAKASTKQSSAFPDVQAIIDGGKKTMPPLRSRPSTANSRVQNTGTRETATRASKPFEWDEDT